MSSTLWTAEKVADKLEVNESWVLKEARAGRLPSVKVGHYVRFIPESIFEWVKAKERNALPVRTRSGSV